MNLKLIDFLRPEYIELGMVAHTKEELIDRMITIAARNPSIRDIKEVRKAIFKREGILSTGIGNGCAIPHGKTDAVNGIVMAFGVTAEPVEYESLDQGPVRIVLFIVRRDSDTALHLRLLARAAKILNSPTARAALLAAKNWEEIMDIFYSEEQKLDRIQRPII